MPFLPPNQQHQSTEGQSHNKTSVSKKHQALMNMVHHFPDPVNFLQICPVIFQSIVYLSGARYRLASFSGRAFSVMPDVLPDAQTCKSSSNEGTL